MKHTKLFSCLYGSRLYGTQTPTSDLDVKHVVLPDIDHLLLGKQAANKVKKTNTVKNTRNSADDVDEEYIPIQVFAYHFYEGQTYALELAYAVEDEHAEQTFYTPAGLPINGDMVRADNARKPHRLSEADRLPAGMFLTFVLELREKFLTSNIKAMMGYAVNQASLYSFKGERLNVAKELYATLLSHFTDPDAGDDPLTDLLPKDADFDYSYGGVVTQADQSAHRARDEAALLQFKQLELKYPKYFKVTEYDIGGGRMRPCFIVLEKYLPWTNSLGQTMDVVQNLIKKYGARADAASADNVDWKATMHALRIVDEGLSLLGGKGLKFPFEQAYIDRLLAIKRGGVPLAEVTIELNTKLEQLKDLELSSTLKPASPERREALDAWLAGWMRRFYNLPK